VLSRKSLYDGKLVTSFIQISNGITISFDPTAEVGSRLMEITVGGEQLDMGRIYNVATLDFVATGGDNIFRQKPIIPLALLQDTLAEYVTAMSPIDVNLESRIKIIDKV
jgi:2',3'-cyclic-nucleotide 2'-phosphodiesterase (5'-nucleotidase family)